MSELAIIRDGGMLIREGKIDMVGSRNEIEKIAGDAKIVDAGGRVVLPGFVDAHTHLVFAGNRVEDFERRARGESYDQIAKAGGGIWSTVKRTRAASEVDLFDCAKNRVEWFLKGGTTTVEAKSGYGLTVEDELKILRVMQRLNEERLLEIVPTFLGAHAVPREMDADKYIELVIDEMLPRVASEKLAEFCDVFCERGYFNIEQSRKILSRAKQLGLELRIHADQLSNSGGARLAAELKTTTADHLEKMDEQGITAMKSAGVQPVLLPGSVYALGLSDFPRAREMIEAGLAVVIATDFNPGSSPTPSMPMILSLVAIILGLWNTARLPTSRSSIAGITGSWRIGLDSCKRSPFTCAANVFSLTAACDRLDTKREAYRVAFTKVSYEPSRSLSWRL
jgi:imidazolonepropionase